jgi:AraC-like DNA-binding protein
LAFAAGYADQSHLIREFKALAGLTPARFVAERRRVGFVQYRESGRG